MRAQLAVVVGLHSTAVCNHNQTTAPICSTNSSVPDAQDTERLSSTKKHIQDINLKPTASRKVVKNSYTDIVQAFTENGTPVETINTKTDTPMYHTAFTSHPDIVSLMPRDFLCTVLCFLFFSKLSLLHCMKQPRSKYLKYYSLDPKI